MRAMDAAGQWLSDFSVSKVEFILFPTFLTAGIR